MSLSVCCLTHDPGPRVAAVLAQFREVADEIVVAADSRADRERLDYYAAVADRLHTVEFTFLENHLAWLHEQCSADWVLRIDGDEVASRALLEQLPALTAEPSVKQYWLPRRWLFPDPEHWLDELPWWPDFQSRLVRRNAALRFSGVLHSSAEEVVPRRYVDAPLYHLACLTEDREACRLRALRYEVMKPRLEAPGGGRLSETFYLPERRSEPSLAPVPADDLTAIGAALGTEVPSAGPAADGDDRPIGLAERLSRPLRRAGRAVRASAPGGAGSSGGANAEATLAPFERDLRMVAGEHRRIHLRVANRGERALPGEPLEVGAPRIRLSYRWLRPDGRHVEPEGHRTALPGPLAPGASAIVPLEVTAPPSPGRFVLEPDLVEEHVRWFGLECPLSFEIGEPPPPDLEVRAGSVPVGADAAFPRTFHRIWLGTAPMPELFERYAATWREHHPEWEMRLWTDADVPGLVPAGLARRVRGTAELSDVLRYEILRRFGGVYLDTDVECLRSIEGLIAGTSAFAGLEIDGRACGAVLGGFAGHVVFEQAVQDVRETVGLGSYPDSTGPYFLSLLLARHPEVTIFPPETFYPYLWDEPGASSERLERAYAVHHWAASWR